ncbi:MAG: amino acid ABC transporter substrate-binding protein [Parachlamydiaceae bacterium]|nr:amino acid ABC transporter substrate-binding protein [Parachlamydiaceae bacterium]
MRLLKKLKIMHFKRWLTKRNIGIIVIITLLLAWGLLRACGHEKVTRKQFYYIGRDRTWYPFQLMSKERNLIGFTDDLMAAIGKETKLNWEWIETSSSTILDGLYQESYDAIISTVRPTFSNREYLFSDLFFELGIVLVVPQNSSVLSLKDLEGKSIGISKSSYSVFNDLREGGARAYDIQLMTYDNMTQALELMKKGQLNGIITHSVPAYSLTNGFNRKNLKVVTAPFTDEGLRLVALKNKDSEALIKDFNQALKKFKDNGVYAELIDKWDLIDPSIEFKNNEGAE